MLLNDSSNVGRWKDEKEEIQMGERGEYCGCGKEEAKMETDALYGQIHVLYCCSPGYHISDIGNHVLIQNCMGAQPQNKPLQS